MLLRRYVVFSNFVGVRLVITPWALSHPSAHGFKEDGWASCKSFEFVLPHPAGSAGSSCHVKGVDDLTHTVGVVIWCVTDSDQHDILWRAAGIRREVAN